MVTLFIFGFVQSASGTLAVRFTDLVPIFVEPLYVSTVIVTVPLFALGIPLAKLVGTVHNVGKKQGVIIGAAGKNLVVDPAGHFFALGAEDQLIAACTQSVGTVGLKPFHLLFSL